MKNNEPTAMMKQYLQIKKEYNDCILFFRLGDFYEMFFDDALEASELLEITLTGKDCGLDERAPMCGVPFHSAKGYIAKLIKCGKKVAICEQVEDPKDVKKGIVKRDVVRVVTPGTAVIDMDAPDADNSFLACIYFSERHWAISLADISTGEIYITEGDHSYTDGNLAGVMATFRPSEVLVNPDGGLIFPDLTELRQRYGFVDSVIDTENYEYENACQAIRSHFSGRTFEDLGIAGNRHCICSLGAMLNYLKETQKRDLSHLGEIKFYTNENYLRLDANTRRNLEITETMREKTRKGSLLGVLDKTKTAMGARRLKSWIDRPLVDADKISYRLSAVDELYNDTDMREDLTEALKKIYDIERIISRVVYGSCNARDFLSLKMSLKKLPDIKMALCNAKSEFLNKIYKSIDELKELALLIELAIDDEAPISLKEGGIIKKGFDPELDKIKDMLTNSTGYIAMIESRERERTGIKNLKIKYNKVFGYYIEVSNSNKDKVPEDYIRKQTLVNGERYITNELKEMETRILTSRDKVYNIEYEDFLGVKREILKNLDTLQRDAKFVSVADALCSLANVAIANGYVRPDINDGDVIDISGGRHPIVEMGLRDSLFVPNDTYLDSGDSRFSIITGPNMAGKSTYMRQTAIIVLMAQIGSFVPADKCMVGIVDAIFTRVGASDDLASGQSTFMVEMNEVSHILTNATSKSLVILDEIGRGTSTFDGLSIAWAVAEYIADKAKIGAKTLFATRYHELTALEGSIEGIKNYSVAVKKRGDDITFLRKIVLGGTDDSFGIEVAKLAGVPDEVIERAKAVLASVEAGDKREINPENSIAKAPANTANSEIDEFLKNLDVTTLTPIEALNELYKLHRLATGDE